MLILDIPKTMSFGQESPHIQNFGISRASLKDTGFTPHVIARASYSFRSRLSWLRHNPSKFTDWLNLIRPLYWLILPFPLAMRLNMRSHFDNITSE